MDTRQIKYFLNLAQTLNFTQAARLSNITQPTLTKAIQKLEEEYGGLLVYRDGKDSRLTELGRALRDEFEAIVAREAKARELADMIVKGRRSIVNIGVSSTLGPSQFIDFFKNATDNLASHRFVIHRVEPREVPDLVLSGTLDCCFCTDCTDHNKKLLVEELYAERILVACAESHRFASLVEIPIKELDGEIYMDRLNCEFRTQSFEGLGAASVSIEPSLQSDAEDWIQSFVASGLGICLLPEFSLLADKLVLRPLQDVNMKRRVQFVSIFGSPTSQSVSKLRDLAKDFSWIDANSRD